MRLEARWVCRWQAARLVDLKEPYLTSRLRKAFETASDLEWT